MRGLLNLTTVLGKWYKLRVMSKTISWMTCGALYLIFGIIGHGVGSCMWDDSTSIYPWDAKSSASFSSSAGAMAGESIIPTVAGGVTAAIVHSIGCKYTAITMAISCGTAYFVSMPAYVNEEVGRAYVLGVPSPESAGNKRGAIRALSASLFQTIFGFAFPLLIRHYRKRALSERNTP